MRSLLAIGVAGMPSNVLVFTPPPLTHNVEIAGPIKVTLYLSSDRKDTGLTVKLVDRPVGDEQRLLARSPNPRGGFESRNFPHFDRNLNTGGNDSMADPSILRSINAGVLTLTLNRPEVLNSCNREMVAGAAERAAKAREPTRSVRAVLLTGCRSRVLRGAGSGRSRAA